MNANVHGYKFGDGLAFWVTFGTQNSQCVKSNFSGLAIL
jgi:hypothetical protein